MGDHQSHLWPDPDPANRSRPAPDPAAFARLLAARLGERLVSIILHGPGVAGDEDQEAPEHKLLVVVDRLGAPELEVVGPVVRDWLDAGQPMPLFFSEARLLRSAATYPAELLDIKEGHRVLQGGDPVSGLEVRKAMLLLDIERGLKSQLHRICEAHLRLSGRKAPMRAFLHRELPRLSLLLRSTLRLFVARGPSACLKVLEGLDRHVPGVCQGLVPLYTFVRSEATEELPRQSTGDLLTAAIPAYDSLIAAVEDLRRKDAAG